MSFRTVRGTKMFRLVNKNFTLRWYAKLSITCSPVTHWVYYVVHQTMRFILVRRSTFAAAWLFVYQLSKISI